MDRVKVRVVCVLCGVSDIREYRVRDAVAMLRGGIPFRCVSCGCAETVLSAPAVQIRVLPRQTRLF